MRPRVLLSLLLIAITVAVYYPVRGFEFVNFDDPEYVTGNRHVATGLSWSNASWAMTTSYAANWFPLTWLSLMADASAWGVDSGGYHLTNLVLHIANVVLLFLLLAEITGALGPSAFVAALFAVHPLHVESVAWVTERKDVLSTFFGLLAIWAYCRYASSGRRLAYFASLLLFAASLMSKQMLVTLPLLLLLLDVWPLRRLGPWEVRGENRNLEGATNGLTLPLPLPEREGGNASLGRLVREKIPYFILAGFAALIVVMVQRHGGAVQTLAQVPLGQRVANAVVVCVLYLAQTFWPVNLAAFYPYPLAGIAPMHVVVAAVLLCAITAAAVGLAKRRPYVLVGWLWYLVTLAPVIGIVQVGSQRMADRYTYVPLIGIFVAITWLVAELVPAGAFRRIALPGLSVAMIGALAVVAARQVRVWSDSLTLFEHALNVTQDNAAAHTNLGYALQTRGRGDEAIDQFLAALKIDPNHAIAHNNLAIELLARHDKSAAQEHFALAVQIDPRYVAARINLANMLRERGEIGAAIDEYSRALEVDPENTSAIINLSEALRNSGRLDEAIGLLEKACATDRTNALAQMNLGLAYHDAKRTDDAIYHFERAVALDDNSVPAHANLGAALKERNETEAATAHFRRALELDPNQAETKINLATALMELGARAVGPNGEGIDRAMDFFREAVVLWPESWQAHFNLARALQMQRTKPDEVIEHYREAVRLNPGYAPAQKNLKDALEAAKQNK